MKDDTLFRTDQLLDGWTAASRRWLLRRLRQGFCSVNVRVIHQYFLDHDVRKLHLGCGKNILDGWLNTDVLSRRRDVRYLDVTKRFPFSNTDEFDYVFSEHLIEHIPLSGGLAMLGECYRILKLGGKIRITTPDLAFLINICREDKSAIENEYIAWAVERLPPLPLSASFPESLIVNDFMRNWGHRFIYDERTLSLALRSAGFSDITRCELNASDHDPLRGIENESRLPQGYLALESMTLEATKGSSPSYRTPKRRPRR